MREACQCSNPATRTIGETPAVSAAVEICAMVSPSSEPCSASMKSQSKPAVLASVAMLTVRAWLTPRPIASFPARSWRRAWLGMAVISVFSPRLDRRNAGWDPNEFRALSARARAVALYLHKKGAAGDRHCTLRYAQCGFPPEPFILPPLDNGSPLRGRLRTASFLPPEL